MVFGATMSQLRGNLMLRRKLGFALEEGSTHISAVLFSHGVPLIDAPRQFRLGYRHVGYRKLKPFGMPEPDELHAAALAAAAPAAVHPVRLPA